MIITNFKTYESATGDAAVSLALVHDAVAKETGADIRIAVQAIDLTRVIEKVSIPVYAQHVDSAEYGSHTGKILPEALIDAGAAGSLLNHSENRIPEVDIERAIKRSHDVGLEIILCAKDPEEGGRLLKYSPELIAVEPPELIGGDISVSSSKPEIIKDAAELIGDKLLVGAGVKNGEDVKIALKLGAKGVLLASGVTKAKDPKAVLMDLVSGIS